ncbi:hypothetical protein MD484_g5434, partial [Candolleomyces efflorescens]
MSNGFCRKFNNATQRIFGNTVRPIVVVWETNDSRERWSAEARLVVNHGGMEISLGLGTASATTKKKAKDIAAEAGFDWLCSQFPSIDLSDI